MEPLFPGMAGAGGRDGVGSPAASVTQAALDVATPAADTALFDPLIRARYHVFEVISPGLEDALYLARRVDTGALVDLRVLSGQLGSDRLLRAALVQQATLVARVAGDCPGIATAYECERTEGGACVLPLEHPDGPTLRELLKEAGTLELKRALRVALGIGEVLERVHSLGLVHGGLRSDNVVLVGPDESVVLKHLGFDWIVASRSPAAAARRGTTSEDPGGRAPEQAWDQATERSDVYAFGAVLYEMLSGARPPAASRRRVSNATLRSHRADITPGLERIVTQTLRAEPERRPADISAVCNALNEELAAIDRKSAGSQTKGRQLEGKAAMRVVGGTGVAVLLALAIWFGHDRVGPSPWSQLSGRSASAKAAAPVTTSSAPVDAPVPGSASEQEIDAPSAVTLAPETPAASSASPPTREATGTREATPTRDATTTPGTTPTSSTTPTSGTTSTPAATSTPATTSTREATPTSETTSTREATMPESSVDAAGKPPLQPSPPSAVAPVRPARPKVEERREAIQQAPSGEEAPALAAGGVSRDKPVERREKPPTIQRRAAPAAPEARPPADTSAADDPGAIIDWLLGEGSSKER